MSIPMDPDLTVHSVSSAGGRVHFGSGDKGEDVVSLYGTPKEEIPPTSTGRSDNGSFNLAAANGNQVGFFFRNAPIFCTFQSDKISKKMFFTLKFSTKHR